MVRVTLLRFFGWGSEALLDDEEEDDEELELVLALSVLEAGDVGTLGVAGALGDGETWGEGPSSSTTSKVISKMSDILIGADVGICNVD